MANKRLDIQGLRALAVALVVIYHVWPTSIPGGYIGVDIFFVISGFLITAHLMREVNSTGRVALTRFWARRIRRLLPAAFTVILVSFILAVVVMPSAMIKQNVQELGAAALYSLNWLLAANSVDYLAADNSPSLVQHFWSLSVEEQFYIAWPVLITVVLVIIRRTQVRATHAITSLLCLVFITSLVLSAWWTATHPSTAYFATPVRAWEFAAGGLIAFLPQIVSASSRLIVVLSWAAVGVILVPAFAFDSTTAFPGYMALLPVLGTAALIYLGDSSSTWSPQYLSRHNVVQFIGDNSYAIYLWHWPVLLAYPAATGRLIGLKSGILLLLVTVVLAWATQRLVEEPFRSSRGPLRSNRRTYSFMLSGMVLCIVASVGLTQLNLTANQRFEATIETEIADVDGCFGAYALMNDCDDIYKVTDTVNPAAATSDIYWKRGVGEAAPCETTSTAPKHCVLGKVDAPEKVLALVGDSHSHHLWEPVDAAAKRLGWKVIAFQSSGCSGFDTATKLENADAQERLDNCVAWGEDVRAAVATDSEIDAVVFSNRAHTKRTTADAASAMLQPLLAAGKQIIAITDVPGMPSDSVKAPSCVEESSDMDDPCAWDVPQRSNFIVSAVDGLGGATIDLGSRLCADDRCHTVIGGTIVYMDSNHMTTTFSRTLAPWLEEQLEAAVSSR
ncbi:MAG: acyltransferase family protein [Micrococcaceae bacterium]